MQSVTLVGTLTIRILFHLTLGHDERDAVPGRAPSIAKVMRWWADYNWVRVMSGPTKMTRLPKGAHFAADNLTLV